MKTLLLALALLSPLAHAETGRVLREKEGVLANQEIKSMVRLLERSRAWECERPTLRNVGVNVFEDAHDFTLTVLCTSSDHRAVIVKFQGAVNKIGDVGGVFVGTKSLEIEFPG